MRILEIAKPNLVVTSRALALNLPTGEHDGETGTLQSPSVLLLIEDLPPPGATDIELVSLAEDPADDPWATGFAVLTSGTTSVSKIVLCPQEILTDSIPYIRDTDRVQTHAATALHS